MLRIRAHLQRVGLPDSPDKFIYGTILTVGACYAYHKIDGRSLADMFALQSYRPPQADEPLYTFTFNLYDKAYGRIVSPLKHPCVDLADMHDHGWPHFKKCGFYDFRVARADGADLSDAEQERLDTFVMDDILYDFEKHEIQIDLDFGAIDGVLFGRLLDIPPEDQSPDT